MIPVNLCDVGIDGADEIMLVGFEGWYYLRCFKRQGLQLRSTRMVLRKKPRLLPNPQMMPTKTTLQS